MAAASYVIPERRHRGFMSHLSSVALEWLLISLLFVYAGFSYFLTKFAQYCDLQAPCLLCSRLDHIFGNEKPGFYWTLFCSNHRTEVSSLLSCQTHGKLADAQGMCDECLMSCEIPNKSSPESFRLLVGKLGVNMDHASLQSPCLNKNFIMGSSSARTFSCCNKIWRARPNANRLLPLNPAGYGTVKPSIKPPLPRVPGRSRLSRRDSFKKLRDKISVPVAPRRVGLNGADSLSHVGYSELKITSDTESDFPFSDDDDGCSAAVPENTGSGEFPKVDTTLQKTPEASDPQPSLMDQKIELNIEETRDVMGDINWDSANEKPRLASPPELISLDDISTSSNILEGFSSVSSLKKPSLFGLSELMLLKDITAASDVMEIPPRVSPERTHIVRRHRTIDVDQISVVKHGEVPQVASTTASADTKLSDAVPPVTKAMDPVEERVEVSRDVELVQDSEKVDGQFGLELKDTSLGVRIHRDGSQNAEALSSNETAKALSSNDYDYESLGENSVSDIEGESILERLKRQIEYDRRCISDLQRDLDEERNASEVAADQAMAMITRLQEEKALLHMEALQYLRMMEEQAEYDMEALEKANELLAEKEKEVQDLEAELDYFRIHFPDEESIEAFFADPTSCSMNLQNMKVENDEPLGSISHDYSGKRDNIMTALLDFEGEKLYITQRLKKLEEKLQQLSSNGEVEVKRNPRQFIPNGETPDENGLMMMSNGSGHIRKSSDDDSNLGHGGENDLDSAGNEISDLYGRMNMLEADHDFLEQAFDSLRKGQEGSKFIQEISQDLQELQRTRIQKRSLPVP